MPRGYRCVVIAAFGWLILAASPPRQESDTKGNKAQSKTQHALEQIATALKEANKRPSPDKPCPKGGEDRNSDLCAQWRAADAAVDSALWAERTFYLSIFGLIVGVATFGAAFAAAKFAKDAATYTQTGANEAARAANAAENALVDTRLANALQIRPYVAFTPDPSDTDDKPFSRDSILKIKIENFGQIPARNVRFSIGYIICKEPIGDTVIDISQNFGEYGIIAPGDFRTENIHTKDFNLFEIEKVFNGLERLFVRTRIDYDWPGGIDFHDIIMVLDEPSSSGWHLLDDRRRRQH